MNHPYHAYIDLLQSFLARRSDIVACIDRLLNCQKKPVEYQQDYPLLSQQFTGCFFALNGLSGEQAGLRGQLEQAHWASGFRPRAQAGNELVDPAEQMLRAFHLWRQTRWPGQNGRLRFAHTLFNLYVVRSLALLLMRLWDKADADADVTARLAQAQALLDAVWNGSPPDQPQLVRDVRWLFPVAMSPTTDSLAGYFVIAQRIADTFAEADRIETQKAWVVTGAGHLRSQLRDLAQRRNVALDDHALVLLTRVSNALDVSLLMEGLVTLLEAYEAARLNSANGQRLELASAILQGLSPDPELFLERLDLLGPYTMIEHLFITTDSAGQAVYTAAGTRHVALLQQYSRLIATLAPSLLEDCRHCKPAAGAWSPYGALYGFASNLLELMAFKAIQHDAPVNFSMEEVFSNGDARKLAWVDGWRNLPHIKPEVVRQFEYPRQFADAIHARIEQSLQRRVVGADTETGRLLIVDDEPGAGADLAGIPELPASYFVTSDPQLAAARGGTRLIAADDLRHCRNEGEYLVSYPTRAGWAALSKDLLTDELGIGNSVRLTGLPRAAAAVLALMCPELVPR